MLELTRKNLRNFALSKPADETFEYLSNNNCAIAQFLRANGEIGELFVGGLSWARDHTQFLNREYTEIPRNIVKVMPVGVVTWADLVEALA